MDVGLLSWGGENVVAVDRSAVTSTLRTGGRCGLCLTTCGPPASVCGVR